MSYTAPSNDNVDFTTESYTPPGNDNVDFQIQTAQVLSASTSQITSLGQEATISGTGAVSLSGSTADSTVSGQTATISGTGAVSLSGSTADSTVSGQTATITGAGTTTLSASTAQIDSIGLTATLNHVLNLTQDGIDISEIDISYNAISLSLVVNSNSLQSVQAFSDTAGNVETVTASGGEYRSYDDSLNNTNTASVTFNDELIPPLQNQIYLVADYDESPIGQGLVNYAVDLTLQETNNRTVNEYVDGGDPTPSSGWTFDLETGSITPIATTIQSSSEDTYELVCRINDTQASRWITVVGLTPGVATYTVPNGNEYIEDNTTNNRHTVSITPSEDFGLVVESGETFTIPSNETQTYPSVTVFGDLIINGELIITERIANEDWIVTEWTLTEQQYDWQLELTIQQ